MATAGGVDPGKLDPFFVVPEGVGGGSHAAEVMIQVTMVIIRGGGRAAHLRSTPRSRSRPARPSGSSHIRFRSSSASRSSGNTGLGRPGDNSSGSSGSRLHT